MTDHAGMGVSLGETAICIVDEAGLIVKGVRAASEPGALADASSAVGLPLERVGLEACARRAGRRCASRRGRRMRP